MYLERHIHLHHLLKKDTVLHSPVLIFLLGRPPKRYQRSLRCIGYAHPILAQIHPKSRLFLRNAVLNHIHHPVTETALSLYQEKEFQPVLVVQPPVIRPVSQWIVRPLFQKDGCPFFRQS